AMQTEFFAYDAAFRGGVNVAATLIDATNGFDRVVTAPGVGGGPDVKVFNAIGTFFGRFQAYDADFRGGVTVALTAGNPNAGSPLKLLTGAGPGGGPHVRQWSFPYNLSADTPAAFVLERDFFAFDPAFTGGI